MDVTDMAKEMIDVWHIVHLRALLFCVMKDISGTGKYGKQKPKKKRNKKGMTK